MFEIGNIVRFKKSEYFSEDMKFVIAGIDNGEYVVMNTDNGAQSGFWKEEEMEFLDAGDPIFVSTLGEVWNKRCSNQKSIKWIKENWDGKLELNWNSVLFLYDKIGYDVEIKTGEEFKFYWYVLYPIFKEIFFGSKKRALRETKKAFSNNKRKEFLDKVSKLYDEVNYEQD